MSDEERTPTVGGTEEPSRAAKEGSADGAAETPLEAPPATESAPGAGGDGVAELERRISELERDLARERDAASDYMNRWQRAQADFANFRRRQQQEQEHLRRILATEAAQLVLPALDSIERAFATLPESLRSFTWINGIALVSMQLQSSLRALGIEPMEVEPGHPFDPTRHEAIGEVETGEHPSGHVAAIVQRGYEVGGAVLRPTLVQVARAPQNASTARTTAESAAKDTAQAGAASAEAPPADGPAP